MNWRFTIQDRFNVATVIDEPTGWDNNISEIKRDMVWHGIMFTNQGDNFQFDGKALKLLKNEYDTYGVEGEMTLVMEEDCGNGYSEYARGKFMFKDYEFICGDECYVKCPIETTKETKDLRNRMNQKVNLETLFSFDETTALVPYAALPFTMELPSKGIFIKDDAIAEEEITESFQGGLQGLMNTGYNLSYEQIEFALKTNADEIGGFFFNTPTKIGVNLFGHTLDLTSLNNFGFEFVDNTTPGVPYPAPAIWPLNLNPTVNLFPESNNYNQVSNPVQLSLAFSGKIDVLDTVVKTAMFYFLRLPNRPSLTTNGELLVHYEILKRTILYDSTTATPSVGKVYGDVITFNESLTNDAFILNNDDRLYCFIAITERKNQTMIDAVNAGSKAFKLTLDKDSFFKITNLSRTAPSKAKVFAINEVISRIAESITNDNLRAYSEYFGRTDSMPYSHLADGCGGLEVIADGIRIRQQENRIEGKPSIFAMSLQDVFEGLNPIHNIGMGVELDPNRAGFNRLRVENWKHFYNDSVILSCTDVDKISVKVYDKDIFSTFQFGYAKWEAEEYTGLDEFLTKRTYRTTLNQVKNDLVMLSKFIASGYALEITRRKGDNNSKDWRYDKDTFIICTSRTKIYTVKFYSVANKMVFQTTTDGLEFLLANITIAGTTNNNGTRTIASTSISSIGGGFVTVEIFFTGGVTVDEESFTTTFNVATPSSMFVELGNVLSPQNIIDPVTLYNFRISPLRNAMRWMNRVFTSYKQYNAASKILFTDGDANYYAAGLMADTNCRLESASITENQEINLSIYANPDNAKPFLSAERIVFEYPLTSREYRLTEANPYGLIYYSSNCQDGYGWIENISYKPEEGKATFTLIPKVI